MNGDVNTAPIDSLSPEMSLEEFDDARLIAMSRMYKSEAREAKRTRMDLNKINYDTYHLRQDYSNKKAGQSREFLGKQRNSVEQIASFIQQGLVDLNDYFSAEKRPGVKDAKLTENEIELMIGWQTEKGGLYDKVGDSLKLGLLGSLMIFKIGMKKNYKPKYYTETKKEKDKFTKVLKKEDQKVLELNIDLIRQEDWYPDPSGRDMYVCQDVYMDMDEVIALSQGDDAIYDPEMVKLIKPGSNEDDPLQRARKASEANQNVGLTFVRRLVKVTECWGKIIDQEGRLIAENMVWTIADDLYIIQRPKKNPFWHQRKPYVVVPLQRVPLSVWHTALMDAPTRHNIAMNELFNLLVDGGMMATFGIKQLRTDWLENESQVADGIWPGITLEANTKCPPGAKVLERVDTSSISSESLNVFNLINAEFQQSSLTNDLRMGILPARQVKATEIVEASQSITSVLTGIAKAVENTGLAPLLEMSWSVMCQHMKDMDQDELHALIGDKAFELLSAMSNEEVFEDTALKHQFKVYGVSRALNKQKDYKKLAVMMQTIMGSEVLTEAFTKKYDFDKLLDQLLKSLDINTEQLEHDEVTQAANMMAPTQPPPPEGTSPDAQSQIHQVSSEPAGNTIQSHSPQPGINQEHFPPSRATPKGGFGI